MCPLPCVSCIRPKQRSSDCDKSSLQRLPKFVLVSVWGLRAFSCEKVPLSVCVCVCVREYACVYIYIYI